MAPGTANQRAEGGDIVILAAVLPQHHPKLEYILSNSRWQFCFASTVREAYQILRSLPVAVILCDETLPDGQWTDLLERTADLNPRPQMIVISDTADLKLWARVLNHGAYDMLARPVRPEDVYHVVPGAWRQWNGERATHGRSSQAPSRGPEPTHCARAGLVAALVFSLLFLSQSGPADQGEGSPERVTSIAESSR